MKLQLVLLLSAFILLSKTVSASPPLTVSTTQGDVVGHVNEVGIRLWKGIQYAKAPVGDLRFEAPQRMEPSKTPYVANFDAPGCPQGTLLFHISRLARTLTHTVMIFPGDSRLIYSFLNFSFPHHAVCVLSFVF